MTNAEGYFKQLFSFDSAYLAGEQMHIMESGSIPGSGAVYNMFRRLGGECVIWTP